MSVFRSRTVGRFNYSISVDTETWSGEVEFTGLSEEELSSGVTVNSSKDFITVEGWRTTDESVLVAFSLSRDADRKGQINVVADGGELIHSVVPRPEAIELGLAFLGGENVLHELDEIYDVPYPSVVGRFTSEVRYLFDFESHTAILDGICKFDNGTMSHQIRTTADKYFKNMMLHDNKYVISDRDELDSMLELYNSFSNLPDVSVEDVREEYLNSWDEEAVTRPEDFGFNATNAIPQ